MSIEVESTLIERAREAAGAAYCDYSQFPVGAAVVTDNGEIFSGCNIENASYGLACCAERVAIFNAISSGARRISMVAVACPKGSAELSGTLMPCGACRQVMAEFMDPTGVILVDCLRKFELRELLPMPFSLAGM